MKLWFKRVAYFCAVLALVIAVFVLVEHFRGEWALSARLKALTVKGEMLSIAELKPKRPAPDQNVFTELLTLTNQIRVSYSNLNLAPLALMLTPAGRAVVVTKLDEWSPDGENTNDWRRFGSEMEKTRDVLTAIESATRKPAYDSGIDYEKGFVHFKLLPLMEIKRSCQLLHWSVLYDLKQGNLESACKNLRALVTLTAKQTPEPLILCQLVRKACAVLAFNATWQALQSDGWNDAQLATLQEAWQACDFVKDMASSMGMERAMNLDFYMQIRDSEEKLDFVIEEHQRNQVITDGAFGTLPTHGIILNWIHLPVWRVAWAAQDELASLEQLQFLIERDRLAQTSGWSALVQTVDQTNLHWWPSIEGAEKLSFYDRLRFLFASQDSPFINDTMIRKTLEIQTQQQMVLTALGIERYRLKTGKLPPELSALVPECLAMVPHDFMDCKNLQYRLLPGDKDFVLYSVGDDGKDDGGDPTPLKENETKSYRQFWDGRDAVWPAPATPEETKLVMQARKRD